MTLQSSGAISLLDIQNEFGGLNPIGIDEYYGVASGVPTSGTISLSNFYGKVITYFGISFQQYGGEGDSITIDSSESICCAGNNSGFSPYYTLTMSIVKYNSAGSLSWQRALTSQYGVIASGNGGIVTDSSNNIYVTAKYGTNSYFTISNLFIAKYDTNGNILWQRSLSSGSIVQGNSIAIDSSSNLYVCGYFSASALLAKYDTNGNILWQRSLTTGAGSNSFTNVAVGSSNNVYVVGTTPNSTYFNGLIAKYDTNGNILWQRTLSGSGTNSILFYDISVDSSETYLYVVGTTTVPNQLLIVKYDTNGNIQWQKSLNSGGSFPSISVDSSNNVYVCTGSSPGLVAKYDLNGNIQWQNTLLSGTDSYHQAHMNSIQARNNGVVYVSGRFEFGDPANTSWDNTVIFRLRGNGTGTNTYTWGYTETPQVFKYATSTYTSATSTYSAATSSLTAATSSLTAATSSLTSTTTTYNSNTTTM